MKQDLELKLMPTEYKQEQEQEKPTAGPEPVTWNEFEYKEFGDSPKITLSGLSLVVVSPILFCAHIRVANAMEIPMVQFAFVTSLVAFLTNYTGIIRRYELMPFLPEQIYDAKLKKICVCALAGVICSLIWGWNGSAGIIFAMGWEYVRGHKIDFYGYMLLAIVAGSLLMEEYYKPAKLLEFIPGLLFGFVNSEISTLRDSSVYAIGHQFLFLAAVVFPMMFPGFHVVVPSILQWLVMLVGGLTLLVSIMFTIKTMQTERVSVVMGVTSGIMMIGTSGFGQMIDWVGAVLIVVGVAMLLKKQYVDIQY